MAFLSVASLLYFLLFAHGVLTLQVTPNSPCAQYCLDDQSKDPSDPNSSNTYGSDITCSDASYSTTAVGQKFESCVSCLQNSTSTSSGENDQAWFVYNLRYALSACLFDFSNATDADSTPCSTNESCGPLQQALEDGNLIPANETTYSYCSVHDNAVLGSSVDKCVSCLRSGGTETYLANFLLAVHAGCQQQPPAGTNIGIQGTVFSTEQINATYPGYNSNSNSSKKNHGLGAGAIVGIVSGFIVLLIIIYAIFFVACRKRREAKRLKAIHSPLHSRFGATNITSPNNGAYGNPYAVPAVAVAPTNDNSSLSLRELKLLKARGVLPKGYIGSPRYKEFDPASFGTDATERRSDKHNSGQDSIIPTHQAYIPSVHSPLSPNTSISSSTYTNDGYRVSPPSSQSSPMNFQHPRTSPRQIPPPIVTDLTNKSPPPPYQSEGDSHVGPIREPPRSYSRRARDNSRDGGSRAPSRSDSRGGWTRGGRNTNQQGVGNAMASTVESVHSMEVPVTISGPMIRHDDHRFDFDLAQRERQEREAAAMLHRRPSWSPESNDSPEEQWPGNY